MCQAAVCTALLRPTTALHFCKATCLAAAAKRKKRFGVRTDRRLEDAKSKICAGVVERVPLPEIRKP